MAHFSDLDAYAEALNKIDFDDVVLPYKNGRLVENVEVYNKVQKLLDCPELEQTHQFLYAVDCDEIGEDECQKIEELYKLATSRGLIEVDEEGDDIEDGEQNADECDAVQAANLAPATPTPVAQVAPAIPRSAFTILYSAMKDGNIRTGETYSNSIDTRSAKADAISKLERAGYTNVSILAIEAGDPDMMGACDNTYCKQAEVTPLPIGAPYEDDMLDGRAHSGHIDEADDREELSRGLDIAGVKASTANTAAQDAVSISVKEKDDEADSDDKADDSSKSDDSADDTADDADNAEDNTSDDAKNDAEDSAADDEKKDDTKANDQGDDESKLDPAKKSALKDSYTKAFKAVMAKCKFDCSFEELDLQNKVKFFTELSKAWGDKEDPSTFMTDKEIDKLEKIVVKK